MTTPARYDVVVVGGGFAGSLVARALGDGGWRVLVLEAGTDGAEDATHTFQTTVAKTPTSALRANALVPSPDVLDLAGGPGGYTATGYLRQTGPLPYSSPYLRVNGGSGTAWTGLVPRMHPDDFGYHGVGRRWPLGYDDLEPYYRAAEREIGVAADVDEQREGVGLPFPDGYVFPMHGLPRTYLDDVLAEALDDREVSDPYLGGPTSLRVVGTPQARNAPPNRAYDGGRGFRPAGHRCAGYASCMPVCPEGAKYTPRRTQARWPSTVTLRTRAVVHRVARDEHGRVTGVAFRSYEPGSAGRHTVEEVTADLVVLAAHAVENARLLLMSGLADGSGQVGRNLMDHPALLTWGLTAAPTGPYRGPGSTTGIEGFRFGPGRRVRAPFRIEIGNWGWVWALGPPDRDVDELLAQNVFGTDLRRRLGERVGRQFALQFEIEQEADPANRVTLDPDRRDAFGDPRPVLHYDLSDYVKRGMAAAKRVSDQIFALLGAEDHTAYRPEPGMPGYFEFDGTPYAYRGAGHGAGTHLMGASAADSVVDAWQRSWDHPNLYLVGCGSMPSLGTSNPSLTMAALALRSAEHMDRELRAARRLTVTDVKENAPS
ncbi:MULTISPECIES: GMC family oxidoreductase [Catenuloplanes]|uniref:Choline dehydrogenase-like flavoprotein n=1 Tax=Catenuloplanes niger TaxID=587534 RepID=A0AAE3ZJQ0_9ACTN|nr:GMC family oxidoreductase [Catenuloplanes niger]MDR7319956.1 choline dehydrogenase-like flavoprotein [Catenuloplanes niger]